MSARETGAADDRGSTDTRFGGVDLPSPAGEGADGGDRNVIYETRNSVYDEANQSCLPTVCTTVQEAFLTGASRRTGWTVPTCGVRGRLKAVSRGRIAHLGFLSRQVE